MVWIGSVGVGVAGFVLTIAGNWVIHLWMNRAFPDQQLILGLLTGFSVIIAATAPSNMVLNATSRLRVQIVAWAAFAISTITLKIAFVTEDQLWVIPLISLLMYAICITPAMSLTANRILRSAAPQADPVADKPLLMH